MRGRCPIIRHEHLLRFISRSHLIDQVEAEEGEEKSRQHPFHVICKKESRITESSNDWTLGMQLRQAASSPIWTCFDRPEKHDFIQFSKMPKDFSSVSRNRRLTGSKSRLTKLVWCPSSTKSANQRILWLTPPSWKLYQLQWFFFYYAL